MIEQINNKKIGIEEEHHHVLKYWIYYTLESSSVPYLITLDHHIDTLSAFNKYGWFNIKKENDSSVKELQRVKQVVQKLIEDINLKDLSFLQNLKHDEHIDFSIKKNIISKAFVISYSSEPSLRDMNNENIYYIRRSSCYIGCNKTIHDDECTRKIYDTCIESGFLQDALNNIPIEYKDNYILDIDLDYFHTIKSLDPKSKEVFYDLIKNAKLITIATECEWVNRTKLDEEINSEYILDKLLEHIEIAINQ